MRSGSESVVLMKTRHRGLVATLAAAAVALLVSCSGSGGTSAGGTEASWKTIDPAQLNDMLQDEDTFLVNVHVPYEGEIPGTDAFIPYDQITSRIGELPSDTSKFVIYCRSGTTSRVAAQALVDAGVTGFYELAGGYNAWIAAGFPFVVRSPTG